MGRVSAKVLGSVDATTYSYNVRSWTTGISGSRFSESMYYNANTANLPTFTPAYNGNIAGMQWNVPNESLGYNRTYTFAYDGLNRLTNANYYGISNGSVIGGTSGRYNETFGFDKMGNIESFTRNGLLSSSGGYGTIDILSFTYNGNQKVKITDAGTNGIFYGDEEFVQNSTNTGNSCAYDANGNRLYDSNSNIWGIRYNTLNLPDAMQFYQGHQTNYTYSAAGAKLKVIDKTAPAGVALPVTSLNTILPNPSVSTTTTTDYVGNMIYENGNLKRILTSVGYWQAGTYYYLLKDHLGSNRVVMTGSGGIAETSSYYPSGMRFGESAVNGGNAQPYRHTGHEMQEMHGLNWIDNLARFRTVSDGSGFTGVDPLAEKHYSISPYVYCANNPVNRIDPDGREWKEKKGEEIAKQLQKQIASRDKSLERQEQKINAKINKIGNNTKLSAEKRDQQIAQQQGKLGDVQTQRGQLSNLDKGITQLGDSKTSYTFNTVEAGTTATLSSMSDGTVVINNYGTTGNRAHETTHAIQYDNGQIKFNPLGSNNASMQNPLGLEIQSYATEYSITNGVVPSSDASYPRTVYGITPQWLYGIKDPNTGIYIYRPENYK